MVEGCAVLDPGSLLFRLSHSNLRSFLHLVAKCSHNPTLHYVWRSLLWEDNGKNNTAAVGDHTFLTLFIGGETKDYLH